jgi:hypothetical protein
LDEPRRIALDDLLLPDTFSKRLLRGVYCVNRGEFAVAPLVAHRIAERMNQEALKKKSCAQTRDAGPGNAFAPRRKAK